jgi:TPR repeat protein
LIKSDNPVDWVHAFGNFTIAAEAGTVAAFNGLAFIHLHGRGADMNLELAHRYFTKACDGNVAEACYNLGALAMKGYPPTFLRDFRIAIKHFATAANKGSVLAMHKLGHFYLHGLGVRAACKTATAYFKAVVERASREVHRTFVRASHMYNRGHVNASLELYLHLAEMGVEAAESSAARIMDLEEAPDDAQQQMVISQQSDAVSPPSSSLTAAADADADKVVVASPPLPASQVWWWWNLDVLRELHSVMDYLGISHAPTWGSDQAFDLFHRAAEQGSTRARVRVGDYYYYGWGSLGDPDPVEACSHYRVASDAKEPQGHFNLGLAHHFGDGLARDPQLAKRYYDLALEASDTSYLAVWFALKLLWADNMWRALWQGDRASVADDRALAGLYDWWWGNAVVTAVTTTTDVDGSSSSNAELSSEDAAAMTRTTSEETSSHREEVATAKQTSQTDNVEARTSGATTTTSSTSSSSSRLPSFDHDTSLALALMFTLVALNVMREVRRRRREGNHP